MVTVEHQKVFVAIKRTVVASVDGNRGELTEAEMAAVPEGS